MKINTTSPEEQEFLQITSSIAKPPKIFHYAGTLPTQRLPTVAIVGTRKPTSYGREVTHRIAYDLASRGVVVVSGLALGIDAIAHQAALEAGGVTIAVLGNGLPDIYPASNAQLARRIVEQGGALLSEYSPKEKARPHYFLERNRIVAGLADAIIITEAAMRSGTLNTAAHALEQGKDIFAVPGNITSPLSSGCNALIKQGASPLTDINDVLELLPLPTGAGTSGPTLGDNELEANILSLLRQGVRDGDDLLERVGAEASEFTTALTMLELNGHIRPLGGNRWMIR